ncbi:MAG: S9 family peptidase [Pyrinomonadaceae bacterium]
MKRLLPLIVFSIVAVCSVSAQAGFNVKDLLSVKRVADPQLSPDGRIIAYQIGTVDKTANRVVNQIYTISIDGTNGRQITNAATSSSGPRWSPDGRHIAYNHGGQIWIMEADGDDREQVTKITTGASSPVWSPDGRWIAFTSEVYPECATDECNKAEDTRVEGSKVQAKVTERLLFKHWNEWRDRKRTHVFVVSRNGGVARDLTPGDYDSPPYAASSGVDYAFSPDSSVIAFIKNLDKVEAISTNSDIFTMPVAGGAAKNITAGMGGYEASPTYTRDGKYMLFRSQPTATFEADRWRIMRYNIATGEMVELTKGFDQQADEMAMSADGRTVYFTAGERGRHPIFSVPVEPDFRLRIATHVKKVVDGVYASGLSASSDGRTLVFASSSTHAPPEIMKVTVGEGIPRSLTSVNTAAFASRSLKKAEDMDWRGALGQNIHGFVVKPANFDATRKYPLVVLIHGGPQGAWGDSWSYRWNPQVWADQGYVIFMPNPRGSTGYGQKLVDEVSADWGGRAYVDIMNGVAEMAKKPFIDKTRIGAAGASYGGYMVDWILGHNIDPRFKFKALVSHAGVYNLESMATSTEEIWFVNWEFKGMPWENPVHYNRWSPHKFAKNFNTPTLVTAGELDYRVPVDQSLQLYTTLQLKKVDSKLVVFPDEGHWILKPQNSEFWHNQVLGWMSKYLKP